MKVPQIINELNRNHLPPNRRAHHIRVASRRRGAVAPSPVHAAAFYYTWREPITTAIRSRFILNNRHPRDCDVITSTQQRKYTKC